MLTSKTLCVKRHCSHVVYFDIFGVSSCMVYPITFVAFVFFLVIEYAIKTSRPCGRIVRNHKMKLLISKQNWDPFSGIMRISVCKAKIIYHGLNKHWVYRTNK